MALDPNYLVAFDLNPYFVDKDTGAALSAGTLSFYEDDNRTTPKAVYQLSGSPPNYTYTELTNPVTLSAVGTVQDDSGSQVALYYYPYDSEGNLQLYYIVCHDEDGNVQFTRQAWPNISGEDSPAITINSPIINQMSNPQFSTVLFDDSKTLSIPVTSGSSTISLAPDWFLDITATGSATVTVSRTAVAGSSQYDTNPPYYLTVTGPSSNVSGLALRQRLSNNPDIWSPANGGENGWVATNLMLVNNSNVSVYYAPSSASQQLLLTANNTSGTPTQFSSVVQLDPAANADTGSTGYVDIIINLPPAATTSLTSIQLVGVEGELSGVKYNQTPVNRDEDQLFHYYKQPLIDKPIDSYLVGWDFPLNPAQIYGDTVGVFSTGANTSQYIWDQTICFQSTDASVSFSRGSVNELVATMQDDGQIALIQYLDGPIVKELLNGPLSVNIAGSSNVSGGAKGTISLWYTTGGSLPDITSNASIVATLDANGKPATKNGTWVEVPRVDSTDAVFYMGTASTLNANDYPFTGWDLEGDADIANATFFAIVVGFAELSTADEVNFDSISLVPGNIATRPAPKTVDEVLFECERFYEKSYNSADVAGDTESSNALSSAQLTYWRSVDTSVYLAMQSFDILFKNKKRVSTPTVTLYSDNSGTAGNVYGHLWWQNSGLFGNADGAISGNWVQAYLGQDRVSYVPTGTTAYVSSIVATGIIASPSPSARAWITFHYVADARLGVV